MSVKTTKITLSAGLMAAFLLGSVAHANGAPPPATMATFQLSTVYTGDIPDGPTPWLTAEFSAVPGSTTGELVLTSNFSASDFLQGLSSGKATLGWGFYLPSEGNTLSGLSCSSGICADTSLFGSSYNSGPVPGTFNLAFGWSSMNRFVSGSTATYALSFANALTMSPFGANSSGWTSVAHVQGIGPTGSCSGWIVSGDGTGADGGTACKGSPPVPVPEPGTNLGIFALGLSLIGLLAIARRRYRARRNGTASANDA